MVISGEIQTIGPETCTSIRASGRLWARCLSRLWWLWWTERTVACLFVLSVCSMSVLCLFCRRSRTLTKRPSGRGQTLREHQGKLPPHMKCLNELFHGCRQSQYTRSDRVNQQWTSCCHGDHIVYVYKQCVTRTLASNYARISLAFTFDTVLPVKL